MLYKYEFNDIIVYTCQELPTDIIRELKTYANECETILNDYSWVIIVTDKHIMYPNPTNLVELCINNPCEQLKEILELFIFPLDSDMLFDERKYISTRAEHVKKLLDRISVEKQT